MNLKKPLTIQSIKMKKAIIKIFGLRLEGYEQQTAWGGKETQKQQDRREELLEPSIQAQIDNNPNQ